MVELTRRKPSAKAPVGSESTGWNCE
uniref:Uncharacterized protein n=1 Tax=Arundo donax TaxID=35708 RepID=A0A0A9ARE0_ARUDO